MREAASRGGRGVHSAVLDHVGAESVPEGNAEGGLGDPGGIDRVGKGKVIGEDDQRQGKRGDQIGLVDQVGPGKKVIGMRGVAREAGLIKPSWIQISKFNGQIRRSIQK